MHDVVEIRADESLAVDPVVDHQEPHALRDGQGRGVLARRLVPGIRLQAAADDRGRRSAAQRPRAAEAHLVHGLPRAEHGRRPRPRSASRTARSSPTPRATSQIRFLPAVRAGEPGPRPPATARSQGVSRPHHPRRRSSRSAAASCPQGELLNSVEMAAAGTSPIEAGRAQRGVWGVAMWEDVDPQIDFFSVYVGGLTNAYQWTDPRGAYKPGDPPGTGRKFTRKTLQLNFWRPGDEIDQNEREIRFGAAPERGALYDSRRRRCLPLGLPVKSGTRQKSRLSGCRPQATGLDVVSCFCLQPAACSLRSLQWHIKRVKVPAATVAIRTASAAA